jgi:hypothetical protein
MTHNGKLAFLTSAISFGNTTFGVPESNTTVNSSFNISTIWPFTLPLVDASVHTPSRPDTDTTEA